MTFLEAYSFMNENEDNVCQRDTNLEYKVVDGVLKVEGIGIERWVESNVPLNSLNNSDWQKVVKKETIVLHEAVINSFGGGQLVMEGTKSYFKGLSDRPRYTGKTREVEI